MLQLIIAPAAAEAKSFVTGVEGEEIVLPCPLRPRTEGDPPKLLLWYKRGLRTPIFSYNGILGTEESAKKNGGQIMINDNVASLKLFRLKKDDSGLFECRVDYFRSPTQTNLVNLTVIVPPKSVDIYVSGMNAYKNGVLGPFVENSRIRITCAVKGGIPNPNVTWYKGSDVIDSGWEVSGPLLVRNDLIITRLTREWVNQTVTCTASNTNLMRPKSIHAVLQAFLLPVSVNIAASESVKEGEQFRLRCTSGGSYPPANLSWIVREKIIDGESQSSKDGSVTSSTLALTANRSHDQMEVQCKAINPKIPDFILKNSSKLNVLYEPIVTANLGKSLKPSLIKEGDDVYFTCDVSANPEAVKVSWYHEDQLQTQDVSKGVILSGNSLVLQSVTRRRAGRYHCAASNPLATGISSKVLLKIRYTPECRTSPTTYFIYDRSINVTCTVCAFPLIHKIQWKWNSSSSYMSTEPSFNRKDLSDVVSGYLSVSPPKNQEDRELSCWGVNEMGVQPKPCKFTIKVAQMPAPLSSCRLANITASSLSLSCERPNVPVTGITLYRAEVYLYNLTLFANVTSEKPSFNVSQLDAGTSYQIKVYVSHGPVTSEPVVVSAYTSRNLRNTAEESTGSSYGFVFGILCSITVLAGFLIFVKVHDKRKRRSRSRKEAPSSNEEPNPDVVPNIEETYNVTSVSQCKKPPNAYEYLSKTKREDNNRENPATSRDSYIPLIKRTPSAKLATTIQKRSEIYCPVDQLLRAEESIV